MLFNPKTLEDAKNIIENTVSNIDHKTWLDKIGLDGVQSAIDNWNNMFNGINSVIGYVNKCLTVEDFLINQIKNVAPDVVLITLAILVVLNFIGFKKANKYTILVLVIAFLISIM